MKGVYTRVGVKPRPFNPLTADHWLVGLLCPKCGLPFKAGDITVLLPCAEPDGYNVEADPYHIECASDAP